MKILLVLMGLEIGGAETHVLELAIGLKQAGCEGIIASNGGIYENELEKHGIRHIKAPLHNKNIFNMAKSYFTLRKTILKEKPDVVHGHARIPSFILGLLHRIHKFNFVTTAHWVFYAKGIVKYLTNWGYRTVAVSEDIKQYLHDNYKVANQNVTVTINGINTDKFSKDADTEGLYEEFGLSKEKRKIVYISRMDESRSLVAHHLLECAEELIQKEDIEIVIVGDGDDFENVKAKADALNKKAENPYIFLAGARTDIYRFAALSDIFVGVSRSALEAMSAKAPCIIAGNEGYIGIFDEDKVDISIETNFCCRGCEMSSPKKLKEDLVSLMSKTEAELNALGEYGREFIKQNYSVSRMVSDNMSVYKDVVKNGNKYYDAVISGYYGHQNNGDDALLAAIIDEIRAEKKDTRFIVLSRKPLETKRIYGVDAVNRFNFFKVKQAIKYSSLLINGGGSLIQDATSSKSLWYYLYVIKLAFKYNVKTMLYANGIGPVINKKNRIKAAKILNQVDVITLRENMSLNLLKDMGVDTEKVQVTSDPSVSIIPSPDERVDEILDIEAIPKKSYFIVSLREWKNYNIASEVSSICDYICDKYGLTPVFVPMQMPQDIEICEKCIMGMKNRGYIIKNRYSFNDIMALSAGSSLVIGMRLHILMYGANMSVPVIGLVYDPKVEAYLSYLNQKYNVDIRVMSKEKVCFMVDDIFKNYQEITDELGTRIAELKELSLENGRIAAKLIKEGKNK